MYVTQHNAKDFRNLENAVISPDRSINIIFGENGQGKTNLLEAAAACPTMRLFRTAQKKRAAVRHGPRLIHADLRRRSPTRP